MMRTDALTGHRPASLRAVAERSLGDGCDKNDVPAKVGRRWTKTRAWRASSRAFSSDIDVLSTRLATRLLVYL